VLGLMAKFRVAGVGDLPPGEVRPVQVGDRAVCLAHVAGEGWFAIGNSCTHEDVELSDGDLDGAEIECPAHGSRFDVRSGAVRGLPATVPATAYSVVLEGDDVYVVLDS